MVTFTPSAAAVTPNPFAARPTEIVGTLGFVIFRNPDNDYTVAQVVDDAPPHQAHPIVGHLVGIQEGERLHLTGEWANHPRYGWQFKVSQYRVIMPTTAVGIAAYLGSGLIKGIGPSTAQAIVQAFGARTLEIIDQDPTALERVPGVGKQRADLICESWQEQRHVREIMVFLQGHGISPALAARIYKQYGDAAITVVRANPYRLARDISGVGFLTADRIAQDMGLAPDAPPRIEAGVLYALDQQVQQGHVCFPRPELAWAAAELLGVSAGQTDRAMDRLQGARAIQVETHLADPPTVYPAWGYIAEVDLARRLRALAHGQPHAALQGLNWDQAWTGLDLPVPLSSGQQAAVRTVLTHKVSVLTGGPGTGKTTSTRAILELADRLDLHVALASPTGRAAKRLAEVTGRPASTIHRLL
ncbi:MAG: AAA family ATPase, partial [Chloroflexi bacterium]|nr:AAA family ATPase [Chloroflexota bacterium]